MAMFSSCRAARLGILALALLFLPLGSSFGQQGLAGTWEVNPDESDDMEEKIRVGLASMKTGGRGGGSPDASEDPNIALARLKGMQRIIKSLSAAADELTIDVDGNEFRVAGAGEGRVRIFYLDGKKHVRETPDGTKLETIAQWNGKQILIEQEAKDEGTINEVYELGSDPNVLVVMFRLKIKQLKEPIVIKSVYDAVTDG
ncbi:MAG: hypothetical protein V3V11_11535 [Vicinamibacteria bacterium]